MIDWTAEIVQANDRTTFRFEFVDEDGEPANLTGYTASVKLRDPSGNVVTRVATVTALIGRIEYEAGAGELAAAGYWERQAVLVDGASKQWSGPVVRFQVAANL